MALMNCPECSREVSDQAAACPFCGYPIETYLKEQTKLTKKTKLLPFHRVNQSDFTEEELKEALESRSDEAEEYVEDPEKFERFVWRLEKKLEKVPKFGEYLSDIACMVSLVRSYIKKEYPNIPIGTIIGIISALVYIVSPWDLVPDILPVIGHIDDLAMLVFVLRMVRSDLDEYKAWRKENGKEFAE